VRRGRDGRAHAECDERERDGGEERSGVEPGERLEAFEMVEHGDLDAVVEREHEQVGGDEAGEAVGGGERDGDDDEDGGDGDVDDEERALVVGHGEEDADAAGGAGEVLAEDEAGEERRVLHERRAEQAHDGLPVDDERNGERGDADECVDGEDATGDDRDVAEEEGTDDADAELCGGEADAEGEIVRADLLQAAQHARDGEQADGRGEADGEQPGGGTGAARPRRRRG